MGNTAISDDELYRLSLESEVNFINWQESIERRLQMLERHCLDRDIDGLREMLDD